MDFFGGFFWWIGFHKILIDFELKIVFHFFFTIFSTNLVVHLFFHQNIHHHIIFTRFFTTPFHDGFHQVFHHVISPPFFDQIFHHRFSLPLGAPWVICTGPLACCGTVRARPIRLGSLETWELGNLGNWELVAGRSQS